MSYSITQNTSFYTIASVAQKVISFGYFSIIARTIGVENTGQYFFAIAFTTIFTVVADFGLGPVLTREAARHPKNSESYVNTVLTCKILSGLLTYGIVMLFAWMLGYAHELRLLIALSGVTMFFDNLQSSFYSIFRARKNLMYESFGIIGSQFVTLVIGTTALLLHWPLRWLILAYTIPSFLNNIYASIAARRAYSLRYSLLIDPRVFKLFFALGLPFALSGIVTRLYGYADTLLISKLLCDPGAKCAELGWWSVPYKIAFAFQFIPMAIAASVYPVMSSSFPANPGRISALFAKAAGYLLIISVPVSFGLVAIAEPVIVYLYKSAYLPSVVPLQILLLSMIFNFLSIVNGTVLNATDRQKTQTLLLGITLVLSVATNWFFIPRFGITGAALSALGTGAFLWAAGYFAVSKAIAVDHRELGSLSFKIFGAGIAMAAAAYFITQKLSFFASIPIAGIIYAVLLFQTKALTRQMVMAEIIQKIFSRKARSKIFPQYENIDSNP